MVGAVITVGLNYTPSLVLTVGYASGEPADDTPVTYPLAGIAQTYPMAGEAQTYPLE